MCAATAPSTDLHRNEALPAFILDSAITFSAVSAFSNVSTREAAVQHTRDIAMP